MLLLDHQVGCNPTVGRGSSKIHYCCRDILPGIQYQYNI